MGTYLFISAKVGGRPKGSVRILSTLTLAVDAVASQNVKYVEVSSERHWGEWVEKLPGMPRISPQVEPAQSFGVFYNGCLLAQI